MLDNHPNQRTCFILAPRDFLPSLIEKAIKSAAYDEGFKVLSSDYISEEDPVMLNAHITISDCIIADISENNSNILMSMGMALAMGKNLLIISNEKGFGAALSLASHVPFVPYLEGPHAVSVFENQIKRIMHDFSFSDSSQETQVKKTPIPPFFIDWETLEARDFENLCRELLVQMGFRGVEWGKDLKEIDMIAELPRKDPDGYEFKELWLISLGLKAPIEMILDMALDKPDYLLHRFMRFSGFFAEKFIREYQSSITFLIVEFRRGPYRKEFEMLRERVERRWLRAGEDLGGQVRIRIWDQEYLTLLVHRFPNIGYKYFSDEGRIRSETRKSYEELYKENSALTSRQAALIQQLEEEKNARVRAERDAVWKDISFSAAHKIGNPIFAIETALDPLTKRVRENRTDEAEQIVRNVRLSIEKAKTFIEQFKSLAKAQEITPRTTLLTPILEDSCRSAQNQGIDCSIDGPVDLEIYSDPNRISECFDELVINAIHWMDKPEKKIDITATSPAPDPLPEFLDKSKQYILVHFKDNGPGIAVPEKERIFDAFYTHDEHGTGLGLALVRRIIDGHGGGIIEMGMPGKGTDFEIYLPLPPDLDGPTSKPKTAGKSAASQKKGK